MTLWYPQTLIVICLCLGFCACAGGNDGKKGVNTMISSDGKETVLPGKATVDVKAGVCATPVDQ